MTESMERPGRSALEEPSIHSGPQEQPYECAEPWRGGGGGGVVLVSDTHTYNVQSTAQTQVRLLTSYPTCHLSLTTWCPGGRLYKTLHSNNGTKA